ncbi:DNA polymerase III subunit delta [Alginatibacterium sediminis]|uniref:DNA polymerase III subunit delta n=1 Tax=Alginatibacterium sediminis TaxID=2164068 RepID=UPI00131404D0|nr:DNA polymerase III subunit delta [Alginatibacterium sediminis]
MTKIYADRLNQYLDKACLAYAVVGEEPLIKLESCDAIRNSLRQQGLLEERLRFNFDSDFRWEDVIDAFQELSLFAQQRLVEIHFEQSPDKSINQQLERVMQLLQADCRLLLSFSKLNKSVEKQNWYVSLEQQGLLVMVYAPEGQQLNRWIVQRLKNNQIEPSNDRVELLSHYYEGNLPAMSQAIQTIALLSHGKKQHALSIHDIENCLDQASHFTAFHLVDAMLQMDLRRSLHIAHQLQQQQSDSLLLVNWGLSNDFKCIQALWNGEAERSVFQRFRIWSKRQNMLRNASHSLSQQQLASAYELLAQIDIALKTFDAAWAWHLLERCMLLMVKPNYVQAPH